MGLAASQCRLLSLTSRLSDLELRAQTLSNQKVALASATSAASSKYINALNNQYVNMWTQNGSFTQADADMLTCYNAATGADQLMLQNDLGQVLCKDSVLAAFKDSYNYSTGLYDINTFLDDSRIGCSSGVHAQSILNQAASLNKDFESITDLISTLNTQNSVLEMDGLEDAYEELRHYVGLGEDEDGNAYTSQIQWARNADNLLIDGTSDGGFSERVAAISEILTGKTKGNQSASTLLENTLEMTSGTDYDVEYNTGEITEHQGIEATNRNTVFHNEYYYDYTNLLAADGVNASAQSGASGLNVVDYENGGGKFSENSSVMQVLDALEKEIKKQFIGEQAETAGTYDPTSSNYMSQEEYLAIVAPALEIAKYAVLTNIVKDSKKAILPVVDGEASIGLNDNSLGYSSNFDVYNSAIPWDNSIVDYYNSSTNKINGVCYDQMYAVSDTFQVDNASVANEYLAYFNAILAGNVDLSDYYELGDDGQTNVLKSSAFTTLNSNYITAYDDQAIVFNNHGLQKVADDVITGGQWTVFNWVMTAVWPGYVLNALEDLGNAMDADHYQDLTANYYPAYKIYGRNLSHAEAGAHTFLYGPFFEKSGQESWNSKYLQSDFYCQTYTIDSNLELKNLSFTEMLSDDILAKLNAAVTAKSTNDPQAAAFTTGQSVIAASEASGIADSVVYDAAAKLSHIDTEKVHYIVFPDTYDTNDKYYIDNNKHVNYTNSDGDQVMQSLDIHVEQQADPDHTITQTTTSGTVQVTTTVKDPLPGTFSYSVNSGGKDYYLSYYDSSNSSYQKVTKQSYAVNGTNLSASDFFSDSSKTYYLVAADGTKLRDESINYSYVKDYVAGANFSYTSYQLDENGAQRNKVGKTNVSNVKMFYKLPDGSAITKSRLGGSSVEDYINANHSSLKVDVVMPRTGSIETDLEKNNAQSLASMPFKATTDKDGHPIWIVENASADSVNGKMIAAATSMGISGGYNANNFFSKEIALNNYQTTSTKDEADYEDYKTKYLKIFQDSVADWVKSLESRVAETLTTFEDLRNGYDEYEFVRDEDGNIVYEYDENGKKVPKKEVKKDASGNPIHHKGTYDLLKEALEGVPGDKDKPGLKQMMQDYLNEYSKQYGAIDPELEKSIMDEVAAFISKYVDNPDMKFTSQDLIDFEAELQTIFNKLNKSAGYVEGLDPDENKIEYYTNIFNAIKRYGAKVVDDDKWTDKEWLNEQLLVGNIHTSVCTSGYLEQKPYTTFDYISIDTLNDEMISRAQAEYEAEVNRISKKEKKIDRELSMIENEHTAIENKVEEIKTVKDKNIDRSFNLFS